LRKCVVFLGFFLLLVGGLYSQKKLEFNLSFNGSLVNPSDLNAMAEFVNSAFERAVQLYPQITLDHPLPLVKNMWGGSVELKPFFTPYFALGLGFGFSLGKRKGISTIYDASGYEWGRTVLNPKIFYPFARAYFVYPLKDFSLELSAGMGYFYGDFSTELETFVSRGGAWNYISLRDVKKWAPGFMGGLGIKYWPWKKVGIFLSGSYNYLNFKDLRGVYQVTDGTRTYGTVYHLEMMIDSVWYPFLRAGKPNPSSSVRNVREAEFNFSGFSFSAGLSFRF